MKDLGSVIGSKTRTVKGFYARHGLISTIILIGIQPLWSLGLFRAGYILCARPCWGEPPPNHGEGSVEHRFLTKAEIGDLGDPSISEFPSYVSDLGISRGDPCFGSFVFGELASVLWLAETPFVQWGSLLLFPEKHAFTHSHFTLKRFRGRRLQGQSLHAVMQAMATRGLDGLLCTIDVTNPASVKGVKRAGYRKVGMVMQLGSKGRVFTLLSPSARRFGFRVSGEPTHLK